MTPEDEMDREIEAVEQAVRDGAISVEKGRMEIKNITRDYRDHMRGAAEEAAQEAYDRTIGGW